MKKITLSQAYNAMIIFLEKYYDETDLECVNDLLSDLQVLEPLGITADSATGLEWLESINIVSQAKILDTVFIREALMAINLLVKKYNDRTSDKRHNMVLEDLELILSNSSSQRAKKLEQSWNGAVNMAMLNDSLLDVSRFKEALA